MFKTLAGQVEEAVTIQFEGEPLRVADGVSLAAALLLHTSWLRRSQKLDRPRGPYCMMGVCFDCMVTVDGQPSQRACMITVREGMIVERQCVAPEVGNV